MNVKNCRKCGKIFNYIGGAMFCPACVESLEAKFQEVKTYIYEHKDAASIPVVAEACNVEPNQIRQWLREERLSIGDDSPLGIECESCGVTIKSGKFCEKCKNDIASGLINAAGLNKKAAPAAQKAARDAARMRFLDRK